MITTSQPVRSILSQLVKCLQLPYSTCHFLPGITAADREAVVSGSVCHHNQLHIPFQHTCINSHSQIISFHYACVLYKLSPTNRALKGQAQSNTPPPNIPLMSSAAVPSFYCTIYSASFHLLFCSLIAWYCASVHSFCNIPLNILKNLKKLSVLCISVSVYY